MKIQILHERDPDSDCSVRVFVDDVELHHSEFEYVDVDPGRGYDGADWDADTEQYAQDTTAFGRACHAAHLAGGESKYVMR